MHVLASAFSDFLGNLWFAGLAFVVGYLLGNWKPLFCKKCGGNK